MGALTRRAAGSWRPSESSGQESCKQPRIPPAAVLGAQPFGILDCAAPRQIVERDRARAAREQSIHPIRADKTTAAGNEDFVQPNLFQAQMVCAAWTRNPKPNTISASDAATETPRSKRSVTSRRA